MKKFNIFIFSSSRSDFDLLLPVIKKIEKKRHIKLTLIVSGTHLSKTHGKTINYIKSKHIKLIKKINIQCENINEKNISLVVSEAQLLFSKYLKEIKKNLNLSIVLGDRYEALAFVMACFFNNIPIAHIHGGEKTNGSKDDVIRHAITKLSNLHFVSNEIHKHRVINMGENPKFVYNIGLLGYENLNKINFIKKKNLIDKLKINFDKKTIIVSYHPVTTISENENISQFQEVLNALSVFKKFNIIFTAPNSDSGNLNLFKMIKNFLKKNNNSYFFNSLGQELFFSIIKNSSLFLGNSSSGILEVPFLQVPVLNIGDRQNGRFQFLKVSTVMPKKEIIIKKIKKIINNSNIDNINKIYLPKNTSSLIVKYILQNIKKKNYIAIKNKSFFD